MVIPVCKGSDRNLDSRVGDSEEPLRVHATVVRGERYGAFNARTSTCRLLTPCLQRLSFVSIETSIPNGRWVEKGKQEHGRASRSRVIFCSGNTAMRGRRRRCGEVVFVFRTVMRYGSRQPPVGLHDTRTSPRSSIVSHESRIANRNILEFGDWLLSETYGV